MNRQSICLRRKSVYYYYYFLRPTSTKPQAEILKLNNVNGCNDISFGDHSILEGDCIPPLKSHGQALEEELCFPGVLSDNRDVPANLLYYYIVVVLPW